MKLKNTLLEEEIQLRDSKTKELQNHLFGKKSEKKDWQNQSRQTQSSLTAVRGQQPGSTGHGRTPRPDLPVILQTQDLADKDKKCVCCGLPYIPTPALDECNEFIEVAVQAYTRKVCRPAYLRNPGW